MKLEIAIVGAGHAGVEAAFALAAQGARVTLFSDEPCLPYFRPRLIAVAFGQAEPGAIAIKREFAFFDVRAELGRRVLSALKEADFDGKPLNPALADPTEELHPGPRKGRKPFAKPNRFGKKPFGKKPFGKGKPRG